MVETHRLVPTVAYLAPLLASTACDTYDLVELASGFDLVPAARPALAENGTVVAARTDELLVTDGTTSSTVAIDGLQFLALGLTPRHVVRVRDEGDIVFVADRAGAPGCMSNARGAYHVTSSGGAVTPYFEGCIGAPDGHVVQQIGLSPGGIVAFSQIVNGHGALYRGPVDGAVSVLRTGNGTFYNTSGLDVNDAGRVIVQMEHSDGILRRGVLAFDTPEQELPTIFTAIEKLGIGVQPPIAINDTGTVALALNTDVSFTIGGVSYSYVAGVYRSTPTLFNTPKDLTLVADLSGAYCRFGSVQINDSDEVAFEAALDSGTNCATGAFDGIFTGSNAGNSIAARGDEALGAHQFFDTIVLGELNDAGQVSFLTTYSEPLVDPIKLWRADVN